MERVAKDYQKAGITDFKGIFRRYEDKKGKINPRVDGTQFLTAVKEATLQKGGEEVYLNRAQGKLLEKKYSRGKWVEYADFIDDI